MLPETADIATPDMTALEREARRLRAEAMASLLSAAGHALARLFHRIFHPHGGRPAHG